jgi:transposase
MVQKVSVGIDVASKSLSIHIATYPSSDWVVSNTKEAITRFIKDHTLDPKTCLIGAESTGRYHRMVQEIFVEQGFEFRLLNPILTGKRIATSIRKKKTDQSDARIIATLLAQGEGRVISKKQLKTTKRTILRTRKAIVNHRTAVKIMIQDLTREAEDSAIDQTTASLQTIIDTMTQAVEALENTAAHCETDTATEDLIKTIPGFATTLAGVVSTEVGDFTRFPSSAQFKAYVGIDPKVTQSGGSLHTGHITKRGNVHLRSAFYLAAQVARNHDPELKAFYQKKIAEGKPTRVAIVAVARKLCERVYAVVTKGVPYQIKQPSFS